MGQFDIWHIVEMYLTYLHSAGHQIIFFLIFEGFQNFLLFLQGYVNSRAYILYIGIYYGLTLNLKKNQRGETATFLENFQILKSGVYD